MIRNIRLSKSFFIITVAIILLIGLTIGIYEVQFRQTIHNHAAPPAACEVTQAQCSWDAIPKATGYYVTVIEKTPLVITPTPTQAPTDTPTAVQDVTPTDTPADTPTITNTPTPAGSLSAAMTTDVTVIDNKLVTDTSVTFPAYPGDTYECQVSASNICGTSTSTSSSAQCPGFTPTPTNSPTPTLIPTNTPIPTVTPSPIPTNTPTPLPTNTPVPTNTPLPTYTPVPHVQQPTQRPVINTPQPTLAPTGDTKPLMIGIGLSGLLILGGALLFLL